MSRPADALRTALAGRAQVTAAPGCITWELVPEPPPSSLTDPVRGQPGTRLEFRAPDGRLIAAQHRTATMFTWWEGLPDGVGWRGDGRILLRARFRADRGGAHLIGAGGVGQLALCVNGAELAGGTTPDPADPVEAIVVRNTGARAGQQVIQAYVAPAARTDGQYEHGPDESRPVRALAAFARVSVAPGEAAEVRLRIPARAFARYSEREAAWVWPPGTFTVQVGRSSRDLPLSVPVRCG